MFNTDYFSDIIENAIQNLNLPNHPAQLYQPIKYTLESGGKRMRPILLLASAKAFGGNENEFVDNALGIEIFHNFTLLHDDVMDNADVRRGRPTVHRRWNASQAILSGDAMLTLATKYIVANSATRAMEILQLFNTTALQVYEGQQLDMDFESRTDVSTEEYMEMIRLKTSVLLACACKMGTMLADASPEAMEAMYQYGELMGIAFQLKDDLLDTYGDATIFGKEIGGDIINEKKTLLWITAINECHDDMQKILDKKLTDYLKIEQIKNIYDSISLPNRINELIELYTNRAIDKLEKAGLSEEAFSFFKSLALKAINRTN